MKTSKILPWVFTIIAMPVLAGPADYVYTPIVEYGEKEIDFKYGTAKDEEGVREHQSMLGLGLGVTEYWFTEVYLNREKEGNEGLTYAEWENKFQFTETGKYWVDIGFITEIEAPLSDGSEPYELKVGPLFQTESGKIQYNVNLLFERKFGGDDDEEHITEMGYQWQVKYRWKPEFEFGAQGMGEMGEWNHWENSDQQNHRLGPAIFGKFDLGNHRKIKYNAAMLYGLTDAAPDQTFRMQAEYEF